LAGRSSGPEPLVDLFEFTINLFTSASGRKLHSLEVHDLICKIASVVVVGGVRRSALISLSNLSDDRMRYAKSGKWWEAFGHRALANNSAVYTEMPDMQQFINEWKALYDSKSGERGLFARYAIKKQVERANDYRKSLNESQDWARDIRYRDTDWEYGTNPCLTADTFIMTDEGPKQISELVNRPFNAIVNGEIYPSTTMGFWHSGKKSVYELKTSRGYKIKATSNHKFLTNDGWKEIRELSENDVLLLNDNTQKNINVDQKEFDRGWIVGEVVGDGCYNPEKYYGFVAYIEPQTKTILPNLEKENPSFVLGFLRGFFDADGSVQGNLVKGISVRLGQADLNKLYSVQRMLARFGILSSIYKRRSAGFNTLPNGKRRHGRLSSSRFLRIDHCSFECRVV
jgi:hypothetical protein